MADRGQVEGSAADRVYIARGFGAVSSGVEHVLHTDGVGGSKPSPPTTKRSFIFIKKNWPSGEDHRGRMPRLTRQEQGWISRDDRVHAQTRQRLRLESQLDRDGSQRARAQSRLRDVDAQTASCAAVRPSDVRAGSILPAPANVRGADRALALAHRGSLSALEGEQGEPLPGGVQWSQVLAQATARLRQAAKDVWVVPRIQNPSRALARLGTSRRSPESALQSQKTRRVPLDRMPERDRRA